MSRKKTLVALEIRADGEPVVNLAFPNDLASFQKFVGGTIDCVYLPPNVIAGLEKMYDVKLGKRACIVIHDEGLLIDLPPNFWATLIAMQAGHELIVGDVLICDVP